MDVGQKILAKVESEGKKRLRPSRIENRDYMVGGKRETGGEERERQVYTSHNSSSEQSVGLCDICHREKSQELSESAILRTK